jgi:hypothetical protein
MNLERKTAGVSLRLWTLIANLAGNVLMVHGAVHYFIRGTQLTEMVAGIVITAVCIAILSIPNR